MFLPQVKNSVQRDSDYRFATVQTDAALSQGFQAGLSLYFD